MRQRPIQGLIRHCGPEITAVEFLKFFYNILILQHQDLNQQGACLYDSW